MVVLRGVKQVTTPVYARVSGGRLVPSRDVGPRNLSQMKAKWNRQQSRFEQLVHMSLMVVTLDCQQGSHVTKSTLFLSLQSSLNDISALGSDEFTVILDVTSGQRTEKFTVSLISRVLWAELF